MKQAAIPDRSPHEPPSHIVGKGVSTQIRQSCKNRNLKKTPKTQKISFCMGFFAFWATWWCRTPRWSCSWMLSDVESLPGWLGMVQDGVGWCLTAVGGDGNLISAWISSVGGGGGVYKPVRPPVRLNIGRGPKGHFDTTHTSTMGSPTVYNYPLSPPSSIRCAENHVRSETWDVFPKRTDHPVPAVHEPSPSPSCPQTYSRSGPRKCHPPCVFGANQTRPPTGR